MDERASRPTHGDLVATDLAAPGLRPQGVLDLSVNVNPYGPCPAVRDARPLGDRLRLLDALREELGR